MRVLERKIVILGSGCIGLMVLQACRVLGASEIIVVDLIEKRLRMAQQLGAKTTVNGGTRTTRGTSQKSVLASSERISYFETAGSPATAKTSAFFGVARRENHHCRHHTRRDTGQFPVNQQRGHN